MSKYLVNIPFTGYLSVEVEADSLSEAKEKVWDEDLSFSIEKLSDNVDIGEVELHEYVTRGNVCSAVLSEIDGMEID